MTSSPDNHAPTTNTESAPIAQDIDVFQDLIALAHEAPSRSKFMTELLKSAGAFFKSPYATIHVRYLSEVIQDDWHSGPTNPNFWKAHVQEFLTDALAEARSRAKILKSKSGVGQAAYLSAPIHDPTGPAIGAIAVVVTEVTEINLTHALMKLESICRFGSFCAEFVGRCATEQARVEGPNRALARGSTYETPHELAFALTNELRNKLGCELVALGLVKFRSVDLLSISGLHQVALRSPGVARLRAAMEECLDAREPISHPPGGDWHRETARPVYRLHARWQRNGQCAAVATVPLRVDGEVRAVLSLRREDGGPFQDEELEAVRAQIEPFAPALILASRACRSFVRHGLDLARSALASVTTSGHYVRKFAALALVLGAMWFAFGTMRYRVDVPVVVVPDDARLLSMPFDGVLAEVLVVEGDTVREGDVLCRLDPRALRTRQEELEAELAVAHRQHDQAMAERKPVDARLAEAQLDLIRARMGLLAEQRERTVIRSPLDGIVVEGDLRQFVGATLARGDTLFRVSPPDRWRLELEIPQHSVADIGAPLRGVFASHARPEEVYSFQVARLLPNAVERSTRTVYVAEAVITARNTWIRPGMEGTAKVDVGERRVFWVALHRIIDYLRIHLWL